MALEIDGGTHGTPDEIAADAARSAYLEGRGYTVLRVHNDEVYENLDGVIEYIHRALNGEDC